MKKSKFTEEQIAFALHQAQTGVSVEEVCRKIGVSQARSTPGRRSTRAWA
jgi:putative transposase